jgi:hypothetical protein
MIVIESDHQGGDAFWRGRIHIGAGPEQGLDAL